MLFNGGIFLDRDGSDNYIYDRCPNSETCEIIIFKSRYLPVYARVQIHEGVRYVTQYNRLSLIPLFLHVLDINICTNILDTFAFFVLLRKCTQIAFNRSLADLQTL